MKRTFHAWAILKPGGHVVADTLFESEAHAWQIVLGWPGTEEIEEAKRHGFKARYVAITFDDDELPPVPT